MRLPSFNQASFFPRFVGSSSPLLRCFSALVELGDLVHRPRYGHGSRLDQQATDHELDLVSALKSCCVNLDVSLGRKIHCIVLKTGLQSNNFVENSLLNMYAKCGHLGDAQSMFDSCSKLDPVSYNIMIAGYAMHGHANISLEVYADLQTRGLKLNAITFIGVLSACCHAGMVDLGKRYFESMKSEHKVNPDIKHYGCMVDLLGRSGQLEEAEKLIKSMPMEADVVIWGTLLSACRTHENVDVGKRAAENLARLEPSHGASRVLLSNLYADAGKWEDAFSVRKTMHSNRIQRLPGYSGVI
ncbi:Pentatricopeptide repeat-containing protein At5g19020, mitochondrial [Linum perenne]